MSTPSTENRYAILLLLTANSISGFAQGVSMISIPWYFIHVLELERLYGQLFSGITLATLLWSLYAGTLIDRYSRQRIFMGINAIGLCFIAAIAGLNYASPEHVTLWAGLAFGFTIFIYNIHFPSVYAFMQEIVPREQYGRINGLMEVLHQSVSALGGLLTALVLPGMEGGRLQAWLGLEIEPWSLTRIFALDAMTYGIALFLVSRIRYIPLLRRNISKSGVWHRLRSGIRFLRAHPLLLFFGIASHSLFMVMLVEGFLLIGIYVDQHLHGGPMIYGLSEMAYSIGAIFAGMLTSRLLGRWARVDGILLLMAVMIVALASQAWMASAWAFVVFNYLLGICNAGVRILRNTYLFEHLPNDYIGRSNSIFNSINILLRSGLIALFSIAYFSEEGFVAEAYAWCSLFLLIFAVPTLLLRGRIKGIHVMADMPAGGAERF